MPCPRVANTHTSNLSGKPTTSPVGISVFSNPPDSWFDPDVHCSLLWSPKNKQAFPDVPNSHPHPQGRASEWLPQAPAESGGCIPGPYRAHN